MGMFEGKVALVTGGASGIGAAAVRRFIQEGAAVIIADLDYDAATSLANEIKANGGKAESIGCDVTSETDNAKMVAACTQYFDRLDAAFLNAGQFPLPTPFESLSSAEFDKALTVNLRGAFLGLKAVLPVIQSGGAAVVTSSAAGTIGLPIAAGYSSAKHGVIGLVRSAAAAFAQRGARVNAVCPGAVATPLLGVDQAPPIQNPDTLSHPDYRGMLLPQHVAELALFLSSPRSSGINGQAQIIDAGYQAAFPPQDM